MKELFTIKENGLNFNIKVIPRAKQNYIGEVLVNSKNQKILKIYITAAPVEGKANKAVIALLAKSWKLKKSQISIILGAKDNNKVVHISGDPKDLLEYFKQYLQ